MIEDFQAFDDSPDAVERYKSKRQQGLGALKNEEEPFTDEVLEDLKDE